MRPIIRVDDLGKQYRLGRVRVPYATFREALAQVARFPIKALGNQRRARSELLWALKDVSFEVMPGQVVGVIGRNGAGKSTLLKILARVTRPTRGQADLYGRVGGLLEIGTGFHPELTGRENVYLSGVILGMKEREVRRRFDEIVAFAELEKFIDTPVKHYSSGMYVRLAFAVAAHIEPEILLVDEVLAVGDSGFRHKCVERMQTLADDGCSMLFVSHDMSAIQSLCDTVLLLEEGHVKQQGNPSTIVQAYFADMSASLAQSVPLPKSSAELKINVILSRDGETPCAEFRMGESLYVTIEFNALTRIARPQVSIGITEGGWRPIALASMLIDGRAPEHICGRGRITCRFDDLPLLPKVFEVWGSIRGESGFGDIVDWQHLASFRVATVDARVELGPNVSFQHLQDGAPLFLPYEWSFDSEGSAGMMESTSRAETIHRHGD
jgi:lipopolysaccharide transport system ATP-binding protein